MAYASARDLADQWVARAADDPGGRRELMIRLYNGPRGAGSAHLPFRRAALAFLDWQLRRGVLDPATGSPWWRAVNASLLHDGCEAFAISAGVAGEPSTSAVAATLDFIHRPDAVTWYRAHNLSIARAYLAYVDLAEAENRSERFFLNVVLLRVLYAHAMVARPRLALGRFSVLASRLGDPRLGMTGVFLSLSRTLPHRYPLAGDLEFYVRREHTVGRVLDLGVIQPRLRAVYDWAADELGEPGVAALLSATGIPSYAWDTADVRPWQSPPTGLVRLARRAVPVT